RSESTSLDHASTLHHPLSPSPSPSPRRSNASTQPKASPTLHTNIQLHLPRQKWHHHLHITFKPGHSPGTPVYQSLSFLQPRPHHRRHLHPNHNHPRQNNDRLQLQPAHVPDLLISHNL
ncbi:hypothetical protein CC80DRAFT_539959, partial [Byssothecium circinans]